MSITKKIAVVLPTMCIVAAGAVGCSAADSTPQACGPQLNAQLAILDAQAAASAMGTGTGAAAGAVVGSTAAQKAIVIKKFEDTWNCKFQ